LKKQINIVILAAGVSRRMKNYDPRSCIPVSETTILLDDQISKLRDVYKNPNISIITGFRSDKLILAMKSKNINVIYNEDYINTNSMGSLSLAIKRAKNQTNSLVIPCDIFFNKKTIEYIANIHYSEGSCLIYDNSSQLHKSKIGVLGDKSKVCNLSFYHKDKWTGIVFFNGNEYKYLSSILDKKNYNKKYIFEIINEISLRTDMCFYTHCPPLMKIIEIDSIRDTRSEKFGEINK
jgi:choline kinase